MMHKNHNESIKRAAQLLKQSKYAVAFTGAGISTESGIPDFRSPDSGLWEQVDQMAVASIFGFRQNPQAFYDWVRPLAHLTIEAKPNPAHTALVQLEKLDNLQAIITQNIDMLHTRAGNTSVYELHGHMREATCIHCFTVYPAQPILEKFIKDGQVPHCEKCNGVVKPNVILYGEQLPVHALQASKDAARKSDLMLVIGASLEVVPASHIPVLAHRTGAKLIIINRETILIDDIADVVLHGNAATILPKIVECLEAIS